MTQPTLSLCMIVKNEEKNLPVLLDSIRPIVDELVIVDTGSTDRTIDVAKSYGAVIREIPWENNFALARNESLRHATCDWVLWADADDFFPPESVVRIRKLKESKPANQAFAFMVKCSGDGIFGTVHNHVRLFPNHKKIEFKYRIHEQLIDSLLRAKIGLVYTDIIVQHLGYLDSNVLADKRIRNRALLEAEFADKPNDCLMTYSLACSEQTGNPERAADLFLRTIALANNNPGRAMLAQASLVGLIQMFFQDDPEKAEKYVDQLLTVNRNSPQGLYYKSLRLLKRDEIAPAKAILLKLVDIKEEQTIIPIDYNQIKLHAAICLGKIAQNDRDVEGMRKYLFAAMEIQDGGTLACFKKGDIFYHCGRKAEAEEEYYKGVDRAEPEAFIGLARIMIDQKNLKGAEIVLQQAFRVCPGNRALQDFVTRLSEKTNGQH